MSDENRKTHEVYPKRYLLAVGTLPEGFTFYGPFNDVAEAMGWAKDHLRIGVTYHPILFQDIASKGEDNAQRG